MNCSCSERNLRQFMSIYASNYTLKYLSRNELQRILLIIQIKFILSRIETEFVDGPLPCGLKSAITCAKSSSDLL